MSQLSVHLPPRRCHLLYEPLCMRDEHRSTQRNTALHREYTIRNNADIKKCSREYARLTQDIANQSQNTGPRHLLTTNVRQDIAMASSDTSHASSRQPFARRKNTLCVHCTRVMSHMDIFVRSYTGLCVIKIEYSKIHNNRPGAAARLQR